MQISLQRISFTKISLLRNAHSTVSIYADEHALLALAASLTSTRITKATNPRNGGFFCLLNSRLFCIMKSR